MSKKINYIEGDLFAGVANAKEKILIPHVVNIKGGFGSGFVVPLGRTYPWAKKSYLDWHEEGGLSLGKTLFISNSDQPTVAHMAAQTLGGVRPLFYNHLVTCMDEVAKYALGKHDGLELGIKYKIVAPMFGSQLAGGNWSFIECLIEDCWLHNDIDVDIYYLPGKTPDGWLPPAENYFPDIIDLDE